KEINARYSLARRLKKLRGRERENQEPQGDAPFGSFFATLSLQFDPRNQKTLFEGKRKDLG
ncbi:MAG TPA: hypothetical protein VI875_00360, partial [Candidatus Norongarragalinales archaeon]|nr:hypothetical protein [Candidatus Norongarragalinales archaeon]